MFQELKPLVARSPIAMMVTAEGNQLRVTIQQKNGKNGGGPLSLSIVAAADELDRDLPGEIAKAAGELAKAAPVAEQVRTQVAASRRAPVGSRKKKSAKITAKPKPLKQAKAPRHKTKAASKPASKVRLPGASKRPAASRRPPVITAANRKLQTAHSAPSGGAVKHHASKPDKAKCIADYHEMKAKHGDKLNRELFLDKSETGRRFERLWDMSWKKFVAQAERTAPVPPNGDDKTLDLFAHGGKKPRQEPKAASRATTLPLEWPFPTTPKDQEMGEDPKDTSNGHDVYDEQGVYLSSITTRPAVGKRLKLAGVFHDLEIVSITGRRVIAKAAAAQNSASPHADRTPSPSLGRDLARDAGADPAADAHTPFVDKPRVIKNASGVLIAGGFDRSVKVGEELTIGRSAWAVKSFDDRQILVEPIEREPQA